ncbi:MAG: peptidyl-prolyl cis-trans isomerase B [Osedax symbiont Rs2]|nr:MAG: peptidyl-prolyl cis-trans isomerase B [Osedax symbiont Rs2]
MITLHTNFGDISLVLNHQKAPISAKNFTELAQQGFYDNLIFHRVIEGFMVQGGAFSASMKQKESNENIENEADNGLKKTLGSIAMARTMDPHSASSQFFINLSDNAFLNHTTKTMEGWGYCVFGEVVAGMDVVNKIGALETAMRSGHQDVPVEDIYVKSVTVEETDLDQDLEDDTTAE